MGLFCKHSLFSFLHKIDNDFVAREMNSKLCLVLFLFPDPEQSSSSTQITYYCLMEPMLVYSHSLPLGKARILMTKKKETTTKRPTRRLLSGFSSFLLNVNKGTIMLQDTQHCITFSYRRLQVGKECYLSLLPSNRRPSSST